MVPEVALAEKNGGRGWGREGGGGHDICRRVWREDCGTKVTVNESESGNDGGVFFL